MLQRSVSILIENLFQARGEGYLGMIWVGMCRRVSKFGARFKKNFAFKMIPRSRNTSIFNTLFYKFSKLQQPVVLKSYFPYIWLTSSSRYDNTASTQISNLIASISNWT